MTEQEPEIVHINRVGTNVYDDNQRALRTTGPNFRIINISVNSDGKETWKFYDDAAKTGLIKTKVFPSGFRSGITGDIEEF